MRSRIVVAALGSSLAAASLIVAACGSGSEDRPPVSANPLGSGGETEMDAGAARDSTSTITVTFPDAEVTCRLEDGGTTLTALPANDCLCAPVVLGHFTVTLPCGYGLCVAGGQGAVCEANRTLTLHDPCPLDGSFPAEWAADCPRDE